MHSSQPAGDRYFRHPGDLVRLVLWAAATVWLVVSIEYARATTEGLSTDLAAVATRPAVGVRAVLAVLVEILAVAVPVVVVVLLVVRLRWRRLGLVALSGALGAAAFVALDRWLTLPAPVPGALAERHWLGAERIPAPWFLAGLVSATVLGSPWLGRPWRRAAQAGLVAVGVSMAVTGPTGVPTLLLAGTVGATVGAGCLVAFGAPNRRPSPAVVARALRDVDDDVVDLRLVRAEGGRTQLYEATLAAPAPTEATGVFIKVFSRDSRDADLLYRWFRTLVMRGPNDDPPAATLAHAVDHEALLLLLAGRAGVRCPALRSLAALPDGSFMLTMDLVDGVPLDQLPVEQIDATLLDALWAEVATLHRERLAHRSLRAANVLVTDHAPVVVDLGFALDSADERALAVDRVELLASLTPLVGCDAAVSSATRVLGPAAVAAAAPYAQPLALSAATRRSVSKGDLKDLRAAIAEHTGSEPLPLEQLVRVRPRTLLTIAALSAAFYVLLPQLANVGDSFRALRTANWWWIAVAVAMSGVTYVASAIGLSGGVPEHLPLFATTEAQFASSFINRVTPANVGGMALNVRFMQKAGVDPAEAVTGMSLNVLAGGVVHAALLALFLVWAGRSGSSGFAIPSSSTLLVVIAVLLAVAGVLSATTRGRHLIRHQVFGFIRRGWRSLGVLAHSPMKLLALFGGSLGVTLAYTCALYAAIAAFDGGVSFADVGAVYLGSSVIAAAAPTPGGLGAMEAALVAGFTAIGMDPGVAVAAVLSYRLATYWLPILPGWLSFHLLEHRSLI